VTAVTQLPEIGQSDTRPTIVEALSAAMNEIKAVKKGELFSAPGMGQFNFRGIDAVMNAAGPAFRKHGVISMPFVERIDYRDVRTSREKASREVTVRVRYRFYGPRGDSLEAVVCGESMDGGDRGTAKAMSVAYRTVLLQVLCLPTHDPDPDSQGYQRGTGSVSVEVRAEQRDAERPSRAELLERVNTVAGQAQALRGESEYAALDRLSTYCQGRLGVNVVRKQTDEGAVEDIDLTRLTDGQLTLLLNVITKSVRELQSAGQEA
jgi:hypothetical protein